MQKAWLMNMNQFGLFKCRRHAGERQSNAGREAKPTLTQQVNEFKSHLWKNFICICYQIPFVSANRLHLYLQWMIVHPGPVSQYTAEKKDHSGLNLSRARRYLLLVAGYLSLDNTPEIGTGEESVVCINMFHNSNTLQNHESKFLACIFKGISL